MDEFDLRADIYRLQRAVAHYEAEAVTEIELYARVHAVAYSLANESAKKVNELKENK